jgi:hypothetical protein
LNLNILLLQLKLINGAPWFLDTIIDIAYKYTKDSKDLSKYIAHAVAMKL